MSGKQTLNWKVRPGYAFAAGAGIGGGLFVFEFLNGDENRVYGMCFAGLGMAGGLLGGKGNVVKEMVKQLLMKGGAAGYKAVSGNPYGLQGQQWSPVTGISRPFSSNDLSGSSGRVTVLGVSALKHGVYGCYVSASDGIISRTPLFSSVSVDVAPQNFDLQVGVILGAWWEGFDVPNA